MNWLAKITVLSAALITALPAGAQQSFPVETQPVYSAPVNPQPVYSAPNTPQPANPAPVNSQPVNSAPVETQPVQAQPSDAPQAAPAGTQSSCIPLRVIGGEGTQVEKEVSPPSTGITRNNWNTDFQIPPDSKFSRYIAAIFPIDGGPYQVLMSFKFADKTAETVYNDNVELNQDNYTLFTAIPRADKVPTQVNLSIGGLNAGGKSYTAAVSGCY